MVDDLPTGYYLENFNFLLDFVHRHYEDLLSPQEIKYRSDFQELILDSQRLYVRLTSRRGPLFRVDKLFYPEIGCIEAAINELQLRGFLHRPETADSLDLLALLTKQELYSLFEDLDRKLRREHLDDFIVEKYGSRQIFARLDFSVIEPLGQVHLQMFKLLFFGNLHQDFTEFVLRDLGLSPFENYIMDASARYFDNREMLDGMMQSYQLGVACQLTLEEGSGDSIIEFSNSYLLPLSIEEPVLQRRYSKLYNATARQLERFDKLREALPLYEKSTVVPARERQSRIHEKLGDTELALTICEDIHETPKDEIEFEFAVKFSARLRRRHKLGQDWMSQPEPEDFHTEEICIRAEPDTRVEVLACQWFDQQGKKAWYVENDLMRGLFGLYFWDVIFAPIKGVFFNPFQRGPVDLFTPEFLSARQALIDSHLNLMFEDSFFVNTIWRALEEKFGIANHFVNWHQLNEDLVAESLSRISLSHLKVIFERLLRDLRRNRSGFPDLIVFPSEGGYCLTEVKGPGDRLQDNQRRWFRFFAINDIPAKIVNISFK